MLGDHGRANLSGIKYILKDMTEAKGKGRRLSVMRLGYVLREVESTRNTATWCSLFDPGCVAIPKTRREDRGGTMDEAFGGELCCCFQFSAEENPHPRGGPGGLAVSKERGRQNLKTMWSNLFSDAFRF